MTSLRRGKLQGEDELCRRFACDVQGHWLLQYRNDWPAEGGAKAGKDARRGACNAAVASALFAYVASYHVPTHWVEQCGEEEVRVERTEPLPVAVTVWNFALDDLGQRLGVPGDEPLRCPVLEMSLRHPELASTVVGADHLCALGLSTPDEMQRVDRLARKVNAVLKSFLERRGLKLLRLTLAFGRRENGELCLTGGLTADEMDLLDLQDTDFRTFTVWKPRHSPGGYGLLLERFVN